MNYDLAMLMMRLGSGLISCMLLVLLVHLKHKATYRNISNATVLAFVLAYALHYEALVNLRI